MHEIGDIWEENKRVLRGTNTKEDARKRHDLIPEIVDRTLWLCPSTGLKY